MIDLHTHSFLSDGKLIPSELVRYFEVMGYEAVAITDHADSSNLNLLVSSITKTAQELNEAQSVRVIPGVELTHVPPVLIAPLVERARALGVALVVLHGETIVEPVTPGANLAGIEAGVDILAHPGLMTEEEARLAAQKDVCLEISGRHGHSFTNGHVVKLAGRTGAKMVLNSDAHGPEDILTKELAAKVVQGAGLPEDALQSLLKNSHDLLGRRTRAKA